MTTYQFHYPASSEATLAIAVPEKLRGKPLKIVVEEESAEENVKSSINEFLEKYTDVLKGCPSANVHDEQLPVTSSKKSILGLRGIMKGCTPADLEDARYEYLMEKYVHD